MAAEGGVVGGAGEMGGEVEFVVNEGFHVDAGEAGVLEKYC